MPAGDTLGTTLSSRLGGRLTQAQCLPYLNSALAIIEAAASYSWELIVLPVAAGSISAVTGQTPSPSGIGITLDVGKKVSLSNANGLPIPKVTSPYALSSAAGFIGVSPTTYNNWIFVAAGNTIQLFPTLNPVPAGGISIVYHAQFQPLVVGPVPLTPWGNGYPWMDDLLLDYAEMEARRVLGWVGSQAHATLFDAWKGRLIEAKGMYSSDRENTGPVGESQTAEAEKTNLGRA